MKDSKPHIAIEHRRIGGQCEQSSKSPNSTNIKVSDWDFRISRICDGCIAPRASDPRTQGLEAFRDRAANPENSELAQRMPSAKALQAENPGEMKLKLSKLRLLRINARPLFDTFRFGDLARKQRLHGC